jgi:hypothetical protein
MKALDEVLEQCARREHHVGKGFIQDGVIDPAR